jgi:hypothetical protein
MTPVLARKIADDIRAVQALARGIHPDHLDPIIKECGEEAPELVAELRAVQGKSHGISSHHLDKAAGDADAAAKLLMEEAPVSGPPVVVDVPYLSQTEYALNCTMGNWDAMSAEPHSYAYEWRRDGTAVAGSTGDQHALLPEDVGKSFTCAVTATNANGSATSESNPVVVIEP